MKYRIIYADPPWTFKTYSNKGKDRSPEKHYVTQDLAWIKSLPVQEIAADDCVLLMWVTFPLLQEGLDTIKAWGFTYKTCAFNWVKQNKRAQENRIGRFLRALKDPELQDLPKKEQASRLAGLIRSEWFMGLGYWTRANSELCLLATRGEPSRVSKGVHQVLDNPIGRHSEKPQEARDRIVQLLGDLPRIELFARIAAPGWDYWGNEVESSIDLEKKRPLPQIKLFSDV